MAWEIIWTIKGPDGPTVKKTLVETDAVPVPPASCVLAALHAIPDVMSISATRKPPWPASPIKVAAKTVASELAQGTVVPFLGAGASYCARPQGATWSSGSSFPPSAKELADELAGIASFPGTYPHEWSDLSQIASYYCLRRKRKKLNRLLRDIFLPAGMESFKPKDIIEDAAGGAPAPAGATPFLTPQQALAKVRAPMLIVTTNYDMLMEQAFLAEHRTDFDVVMPSTNLSSANAMLVQKSFGEKPILPKSEKEFNDLIDPLTRTVIFKMHGSVFPDSKDDSFVITEDDYVAFLARMAGTNKVVPSKLEQHFNGRSFLFLGYGLRDWNLRILLQNLKSVLPPRNGTVDRTASAAGADATDDGDEQPTHWAIQYFPMQADTELWQGRGVEIIHRDLREFAASLAAELKKMEKP